MAQSGENHVLDAPLGFESNHGQADTSVAFISHGGGYTLLLSPRSVILLTNHRRSTTGKDLESTIRTTFLGGNAHVGVRGVERIQGVSNYFVGADSSHWLRNIPHFARVEYQDIYPGITLAYYGKQNYLEYDFEIAPHANPKSIGFSIAGAHPALATTGDLILTTPAGNVAWRKPLAYQMIRGEKRKITCSYALAGNQVRFALGRYDPAQTLTIDPPLVWGSFLGGTSYEWLSGLQVDAAGEIVVAGTTHSVDFPTTPGAYDRSFHTPADPHYALDVFVAKFSPDGKSLIYSTYVGGSNWDYAYGLAVDALGNAYVSGTTYSTDFPYISGSYRSPAVNNFFNNYLFKLDTSGANLVYSLSALASGPVAFDSSGAAYNAGMWALSNVSHPFTPGAYHNQLVSGKTYVSVAKYNPAGTGLDYAALIGSTGITRAYGITVDGLGEEPFPAIVTPWDIREYRIRSPPGEPAGSGVDALVTKFNAAGTDLVYSALLASAEGRGISSDAVGNVAVVGTAEPSIAYDSQRLSADIPELRNRYSPRVCHPAGSHRAHNVLHVSWR